MSYSSAPNTIVRSNTATAAGLFTVDATAGVYVQDKSQLLTPFSQGALDILSQMSLMLSLSVKLHLNIAIRLFSRLMTGNNNSLYYLKGLSIAQAFSVV